LLLIALSASQSFGQYVIQYYAATQSFADGWVNDGALPPGTAFTTTGAHCSAPGCDATISTRYNTLMFPTNRYILVTPQVPLLVGSNYTFEICVPTSAGNIAPVLNVVWSFTNADDGFGGTPVFDASAYNSTHYKSGAAQVNNIWYLAGQFRATAANVTIKAVFDDKTTPPSGSVRWNEGAYRLTLLGDCRGKVPQLSTVDGPLVDGQTSVTVLGVTNGATTVNVYANGTKIGTASGFNFGTNTTGNVTVNVSPAITKNQLLTASQVFDPGSGCGAVESYLPAGGQLVGGGPNSVIRAVFEVGKNTALTGPVGVSAPGTGTPIYWVGSAGRATAITGASFNGGATLNPTGGWQTVAFNNQDGVNLDYNDNTSGVIAGNFGVLDGIAFAIESDDTGPYNIYIDNIMNGTNVLFDAETNTLGSAPFFNTPNAGGNFGGYNSAVNILPDPNLNVVINTNADTGTKSLLLAWQFGHNAYNTTWMHVSTKNLPQVDLNQAISMRVLVLQVGTVTNTLTIVSPVYLPNQFAVIGTTVNYSMAAARLAGTESGSVSYKWQLNGNDLSDNPTGAGSVITGSQTANLQIANVQTDMIGTITCVVTTSGLSSSSVSGQLNVGTSVPPSNLSYSGTVLNWSAGVLQSTHQLLNANTVWTDVAGATSPYTVVPSATPTFYRVRGQ